MKSERRHELQHNDLQEWIVKSYDRVVPYRSTVLGIGLLAVVLLIGLWIWRSHAASQAADAWASLGVPVLQTDIANDQMIPFLQQRTIQPYPDSAAADWARVFQGDTSLMVGENRILADKKTGEGLVNQALEAFYNKALETATNPAVREQAMFGKARALESMIRNKDQLRDAAAAYDDFNTSFPKRMYKAIADKRLEGLKKPDTLKFYEALAKYERKPKVTTPPSDLETPHDLPESPHSALEKLGPLTPLPDYPDTTGRPGASPSGGLPSIPAPANSAAPKPAPRTVPPLMPDTPKAERPKAEPPIAEPPKPERPKAEPPKSSAAGGK
jgi:hypothetical protein